jgi:hypothetical protein
MGLVEILVGICCFIVACIPIIGLFSFNMENTKIIHAKSLTYSNAAEIMNQLLLFPTSILKQCETIEGESISIPASATSFFLIPQNDQARLTITTLPPNFSRGISITKSDTDSECFSISVSIQSPEHPRADILISQLVSQNLGGR